MHRLRFLYLASTQFPDVSLARMGTPMENVYYHLSLQCDILDVTVQQEISPHYMLRINYALRSYKNLCKGGQWGRWLDPFPPREVRAQWRTRWRRWR